MALEPLITTADLLVRGIPTSSASTYDIAAASAAVRDAAGCAITRTTSTVTMSTEASRRIELPARPVHAVTAVLLDGEPVTDWVLRGSSLWRARPWARPGDIPSELTVTFEHGWDEVPADIVELVCSLVAGAAAEREAGPTRGKAYENIDDYRVGYIQDADAERVSPFELPERTRTMLRRRFGTTAAVTGGVR